MGQIVIVAYRPKPGKQDALKQLMKIHVPRLKQEGLITDREAIIMETADGTIIEVFEWRSPAAIEQAHQNEVVRQMWGEYAAVCDYVPLDTLKEAGDLFAEFKAVN